MSTGFDLNVSDIWRRDFLVLLGFFLLFQITQVLLIEFYPVSFNSPRPPCMGL